MSDPLASRLPTRSPLGALLALALATLPWIARPQPPAAAAAASTPPAARLGPAQPIASAHLHQLLRLTPRLVSGSSPTTDAEFAELASLGVTTVLSVDGARPEVERARRHGLRYVHLPIGYDGISTNRQAEFARAASSATGTVYVHCHHGRHRGPAAAAIVAAWTENWSRDQTRAWLEQAGTGREYPGLHRCVADTRPDPVAASRVGRLPEVAATSTVVEAMVRIDQHLEHLEAAQPTGFDSVPGHPDLAPPHEATLLREQFRELLRLDDTVRRDEEYRRLAADSERAATALESALRDAAARPDVRARALQSVRATCTPCHRAHRDGGASPGR